MNSEHNYRLYSFVANHYLSPLQHGLQTAHVVGNLAVKYSDDDRQDNAFRTWAAEDKTIIICGAGNHQGVLDCWVELVRTGLSTDLVGGTIFFEDEQSMNGMATACGVIVPQKYWDTTFTPADVLVAGMTYSRPAFYTHVDETGGSTKYELTHPEGQFIDCIKKYRLA